MVKIRSVCKKCKLLKDGVCKDNHEPRKGFNSSIYQCSFRELYAKDKTKSKSKDLKKLKAKLWKEVSLYVRKRDKKCLLCGKEFPLEKLSAHHYIHTDASSPKYRYEPKNLVSLCYTCHIHKIHGGSMSHILELEKNLISSGFISKEELERIANDKEITPKIISEDYEKLIKKFKEINNLEK